MSWWKKKKLAREKGRNEKMNEKNIGYTVDAVDVVMHEKIMKMSFWWNLL